MKYLEKTLQRLCKLSRSVCAALFGYATTYCSFYHFDFDLFTKTSVANILHTGLLRLLRHAKKAVPICLVAFGNSFSFYVCIYPPDSQKSDVGTNTEGKQ